MDRRTALKLMAMVSASAISPLSIGASKPKIIVVGAGVVGAAAAYYLAKSGASVTVMDKQAPASHASRATFAWLNATWAKQPRSYHHFNQLGMSVWHQVQQELGIPVRWHGSLEWFDSQERNQQLVEQIGEQQVWGEPASMLDAGAIRKKEPNILIDDQVQAAYSGNDGAVDPVLATQLLLGAAQEYGAKVHFPCQALDARQSNNRLVGLNTTQGFFPADKVVLATGADESAPAIFTGLAIPQRTTPGVITLTHPLRPIVNGIVAAPGVHLHQRPDGRVVLGEQAGAPATEAHRLRLQGRPNDFPLPALAQEHGNRILAVAKQYFPALAEASIDTAYIGWRPLPLDGHPVLGRNPAMQDVYLAVMHSGVTLAPLVGKLITREILGNEELNELKDYRPTREFSRVVRY